LIGIDFLFHYLKNIRQTTNVFTKPFHAFLNLPSNLYDFTTQYFSNQSQLIHENEILKLDMDRLKADLQRLDFIDQENDQLKNLLEVKNALKFNCIGACGIAVGYKALQYNTTGSNNIAIGSCALYYNTLGCNNTAIGRCAGFTHTSGCNNTFVGHAAVGVNATSDNTITLGNASIATIRAQVTTITALSDCRDKTNIQGIPIGLDFIKDIRPVKFAWNMRDGAKVGQVEGGFIAQELDEAAQKHNVEWLGLVLKDNPDRLEASPGKLLPIVIRALQELDDKITALAERVVTLES
jgi:hypothetical protein